MSSTDKSQSTSGGGAGDDANRVVEYLISGGWTKQEREEYSSAEGGDGGGGGGGGRGPCTYTISVRRLKHVIDGVVQREIDLERNVHVVGGVDVTQQLRERLRQPSNEARF